MGRHTWHMGRHTLAALEAHRIDLDVLFTALEARKAPSDVLFTALEAHRIDLDVLFTALDLESGGFTMCF